MPSVPQFFTEKKAGEEQERMRLYEKWKNMDFGGERALLFSGCPLSDFLQIPLGKGFLGKPPALPSFPQKGLRGRRRPQQMRTRCFT